MEYDQDKVDEMTMALLYLAIWPDGGCDRAWKGFDWDTLDRLHKKGWISSPRGKAKSVIVTPEGVKKAAALFRKHFQDKEPDPAG